MFSFLISSYCSVIRVILSRRCLSDSVFRGFVWHLQLIRLFGLAIAVIPAVMESVIAEVKIAMYFFRLRGFFWPFWTKGAENEKCSRQLQNFDDHHNRAYRRFLPNINRTFNRTYSFFNRTYCTFGIETYQKFSHFEKHRKLFSNFFVISILGWLSTRNKQKQKNLFIYLGDTNFLLIEKRVKKGLHSQETAIKYVALNSGGWPSWHSF